MAACPHCGQEIVFAQGGKSMWTRNLTPGLGCGSLVAIAIIVLIFSGRGHSDEIRLLSENIKSLETKVDTLTAYLLQQFDPHQPDKLLVHSDPLLRQSVDDASGRGVQAEAEEGVPDRLFLAGPWHGYLTQSHRTPNRFIVSEATTR
jgi:hypothetical protein